MTDQQLKGRVTTNIQFVLTLEVDAFTAAVLADVLKYSQSISEHVEKNFHANFTRDQMYEALSKVASSCQAVTSVRANALKVLNEAISTTQAIHGIHT